MAEEINVTHVLTDITIEEPDPRGSAEMKRMVTLYVEPLVHL